MKCNNTAKDVFEILLVEDFRAKHVRVYKKVGNVALRSPTTIFQTLICVRGCKRKLRQNSTVKATFAVMCIERNLEWNLWFPKNAYILAIGADKVKKNVFYICVSWSRHGGWGASFDVWCQGDAAKKKVSRTTDLDHATNLCLVLLNNQFAEATARVIAVWTEHIELSQHTVKYQEQPAMLAHRMIDCKQTVEGARAWRNAPTFGHVTVNVTSSQTHISDSAWLKKTCGCRELAAFT